MDLSEAINASNKGVWSAAIVAELTFALATISVLVSADLRGFSAWSYVDAVIFGLIAWGIYRRSRICSILGLLLFIVEKILQLAESGLGMIGMGIAGFFVVLFVIGIKGTFAYHKYKFPVDDG